MYEKHSKMLLPVIVALLTPSFAHTGTQSNDPAVSCSCNNERGNKHIEAVLKYALGYKAPSDAILTFGHHSKHIKSVKALWGDSNAPSSNEEALYSLAKLMRGFDLSNAPRNNSDTHLHLSIDLTKSKSCQRVCSSLKLTARIAQAMPQRRMRARSSQDQMPVPVNLTYTETEDGVELAFDEPSQPHDEVNGYQVWVTNNGSVTSIFNISTLKRVVLSNVTADSKIQVRAATGNGWGPLSSSAVADPAAANTSSSTPTTATTIIAIGASAGLLVFLLAMCGSCTFGMKWKPRPDEYELNRADIRLEEQIGQGEFCRIFRASALTMERKSVQAAVKVLNWTDKFQNKGFVAEMDVMKSMAPGHNNVLQLLGQVTQSMPMMLVTEFCSIGNLRDHLLASKKDRALKAELTVDRLTALTAQAANGMEFVSSQNIVHRNVSARNFMVTEDYSIKIGDFGRAVYCDDSAGIQILEDIVPVRWSSPEVLSRDTYSVASDVWAFGIAMFEIFSYGRMVYPGKTNAEVEELILDSMRPDQPLDCPDAIYSTCLQCWSYKPSNRPSFAELVGYIGNIERRLRTGAEDQDLACSKRFIEYQRRPTERIAQAASSFSRSRPGSATSRRSTASQVELLKRTSSTMLFDGGYVLLDSVAGVTDHFIVLDPEDADREAAAAIQDEATDIRELIPQDTPVVIRSQHQNEPVYLPSDMTANEAMDLIRSDGGGPQRGFSRKRPKSFKSMVELNAVHET
eukprot:TRINITY_DN10988_c0_g1_i1.p1 TRINITY_DN10988_c0_g1~~TRINITY_DN10988_c0_g1_i1.p1  ORF type:complete len:742 (+),score=209.63 TRINITY_DN10988_c0_g1_i1:271-2496(+)